MFVARIGALALAAAIMAGCGSAPTNPAPGGSDQSRGSAGPSSSKTPFPTSNYTVTPTINFQTVPHFQIGQPATLAGGAGTVTVLRAAQVAAFEDVGDPRNTPRSAQAVFIAVQIEYKATGASIDYAADSWTVINGVNNGIGTSHPPGGPKGMLDVGTVAQGSSLKGWLVFEVAMSGLILLDPVSVGDSRVTIPPFVVDIRGASDVPATGTPVPAGQDP